MTKTELVSKFIKTFPCFADQIQYVDDMVDTYYLGHSIRLHMINGEELVFSVAHNQWSLVNCTKVTNDILDYNMSGSVSGLTEQE